MLRLSPAVDTVLSYPEMLRVYTVSALPTENVEYFANPVTGAKPPVSIVTSSSAGQEAVRLCSSSNPSHRLPPMSPKPYL